MGDAAMGNMANPIAKTASLSAAVSIFIAPTVRITAYIDNTSTTVHTVTRMTLTGRTGAGTGFLDRFWLEGWTIRESDMAVTVTTAHVALRAIFVPIRPVVVSVGMSHDLLHEGSDGSQRCWWCGDDSQYVAYHDEEWGRPETDDRALFEKVCLEGFQSGLSWLTILRKRENFRRAFADFDIPTVARFDDDDVTRLLADAGIVRHRGKIEATINNARRAHDMLDEHGAISSFMWNFAIDAPFGSGIAGDRSMELVTQSPSSIALSKELKKRGWRFVGPTTVYSFMQSMGLVNDHIEGCCVRNECESARMAVTSRD